MSDYIKREDAIRAIMEYVKNSCDESDEFIDGVYKARFIIEELPSSDTDSDDGVEWIGDLLHNIEGALRCGKGADNESND